MEVELNMRNDEYYESLISYNNYLAHHGVKGQKWGVRRYQNKDGSLTNAGKRRQAVAEGYKSMAEQNAAAKNNSKGLARAIYATNEKVYAKKAAKEQAKFDSRVDKEKAKAAAEKSSDVEKKENEARTAFERNAEQAYNLADAHINNAKNSQDYKGKVMSETYEYLKRDTSVDIKHDDDLQISIMTGEANALAKSLASNPDVVKAYQKEYDSFKTFAELPTNKQYKIYKSPDGLTVEQDTEWARSTTRDEYVNDCILEKAWDHAYNKGYPTREQLDNYRNYHNNRKRNNP